MTDQVWLVQQAIWSRLANANPPVCDGRIYDRAPDNVAKPYVEIGEIQPLADDLTGVEGFETYVTLHVWSDYDGAKEAHSVIDEIRKAVHQQTLDETGLGSCSAYLRGRRVFADPNGITRHGVVTLLVRHFQPQS